MEFIIFLSKLDKEILDLLIKANYEVEENRIECLLNKEIKGLHNFKENKIIICTENAKRKTNYRNKKQQPNKDNFKTERAIRKALEFSSSNFSGTYAKEVEAYVLEDKPKKVKNLIKKYCL